MAARDIVPVTGARFEETLASASPDVLREMVRGFAQRMMDADVEVRCNAGYGEVTPERVNSRNGYRPRQWDTRAGTIELAIPKLRQGTYYPEFLEHRRRAERALASVVATSYLLGVPARRVEKLAASLGVTGLPPEPGLSWPRARAAWRTWPAPPGSTRRICRRCGRCACGRWTARSPGQRRSLASSARPRAAAGRQAPARSGRRAAAAERQPARRRRPARPGRRPGQAAARTEPWPLPPGRRPAGAAAARRARGKRRPQPAGRRPHPAQNRPSRPGSHRRWCARGAGTRSGPAARARASGPGSGRSDRDAA